MNNTIEVINVNKKFGEFIALDNLSVNFEKGKIHGLVGRNGSGKTVLFKCICGFMTPNSGEIFVHGIKIDRKNDVPSDIGIIIEHPGFLPNLSGYKNLLLLAKMGNHFNKEAIKDKIRLVGLDPDSKKHVGKYSLGMRQRLGLAQALMDEPSLLILDEPLNGLDNDGVQEMRQFLLRLKDSGKTIILASHNREDISTLCDTIHEMDHGKINRII